MDTNVRMSRKGHEKNRYLNPFFRDIFVTIENIPTPKNSRIYVTFLSTVNRITSDFKLNDMFSSATLFCAKFLDFNSFYSGIKSKFQSFEFPPVS